MALDDPSRVERNLPATTRIIVIPSVRPVTGARPGLQILMLMPNLALALHAAVLGAPGAARLRTRMAALSHRRSVVGVAVMVIIQGEPGVLNAGALSATVVAFFRMTSAMVMTRPTGGTRLSRRSGMQLLIVMLALLVKGGIGAKLTLE